MHLSLVHHPHHHAGWVVMPETLLDVQLALFHSEVDRVNLLLLR